MTDPSNLLANRTRNLSVGAGFATLVGRDSDFIEGEPFALAPATGWVAARRDARAQEVVRLVDDRIRRRIELGEAPRSDGFLSADGATLAEAVVTAAEGEYEQAKLPLLADLAASIVFREDVDGPLANQLTRTISRLSFRQLCMLAAFGRDLGIELMRHDFAGVIGTEESAAIGWVVDGGSAGAMSEVLEIAQLGLVRRRDAAGITTWKDIDPSQLVLDGVGQLVVSLGLTALTADDVRPVIGPILEDDFDRDRMSQGNG